MRFASERGGKESRYPKRKQPPRVDALVREQRGQPERNCETRRDTPVVANDEVPPEERERPEVLHALTSAARSVGRRRRSRRTSANETAATKVTRPSSESSSPGHSTPAPSAPQKQPKLVSSSPTANLIVFSGTRSSGPRASAPTATTRTSAAPAPAAASPRRPWALPKEMTMKTTSSPSSRTPLKETVSEYQSSPPCCSSPARVASSRCRRKASSSSWSAL